MRYYYYYYHCIDLLATVWGFIFVYLCQYSNNLMHKHRQTKKTKYYKQGNS